jgi:uncharacterized protein DUF4190
LDRRGTGFLIVTSGQDQSFSGGEYPPLEHAPQQPDPYAPVDYPTNPGLPPPVYGPGYPGPTGYPPPPPPGYPPPGYQPYSGGYPYAADPYDPYRPMKPPGTNGKAIGALATALAGLLFCGLPSIVGLFLGVIAMRETKRTGQEGYGIALTGAIIGGLVTAGWVLYILLFIGIYASGWSLV